MTNSIVRHVGPPLTGALLALGFACLRLCTRKIIVCMCHPSLLSTPQTAAELVQDMGPDLTADIVKAAGPSLTGAQAVARVCRGET